MSPEEIDRILREHKISTVYEARCDYSADVTCGCGWQGDPHDYTKHLMVMLGVTDGLIARWTMDMVHSPLVFLDRKNKNVPAAARAPFTAVEVHPFQIEEFLNIYRSDKARRRFTKDERKELDAWYRSRQL